MGRANNPPLVLIMPHGLDPNSILDRYMTCNSTREADALARALADVVLEHLSLTPDEWYDAMIATCMARHTTVREVVRWCRLLRFLSTGDPRAENALGSLAVKSSGILVDVAIQEIEKAGAISQWGAVLLADINTTNERTHQLAEHCIEALLSDLLDDA